MVPSSPQLAPQRSADVEEPRRSPSREPDLLQFAGRIGVEPYGIARRREERNGWIPNTLEWTRIEDVKALVEEQALCSKPTTYASCRPSGDSASGDIRGQGGSGGRVDDESGRRAARR